MPTRRVHPSPRRSKSPRVMSPVSGYKYGSRGVYKQGTQYYAYVNGRLHNVSRSPRLHATSSYMYHSPKSPRGLGRRIFIHAKDAKGQTRRSPVDGKLYESRKDRNGIYHWKLL